MIAQGILVVSGVLVARALGVTDRGHLALLLLIPMGLAQFGALGLPLAVAYHVSQEPHRARGIADSIVVPCILQAVGLVTLHAIVLVYLLSGQRTDVVVAGLITLAVIPVALGQQYGLAVLQGQQRFRHHQLLRLLPPALYSLAVVLLMLLGSGELVPIMIAWVASYLVGGAVTFVVVAAQLPVRNESGSPVTRGAMIRFGLTGLLGSASPIERFRFDQAVVGLLLSPAALGLYVVGMAFTNVVGFIGYSIGVIAYPRVAASRSTDARRSLVVRYFLFATAACGATFAGLQVMSGWLIPLLFGPDFLAAIPITRILLIAALFMGVRRVLADLFRGAGSPSFGTVAEVASWLPLIVALAVLTPVWGVHGVAWSVAISATTSFGVVALLGRRTSFARRHHHDFDSLPRGS